MQSRGVNPGQSANQTQRYDFHEVAQLAYDTNWVSAFKAKGLNPGTPLVLNGLLPERYEWNREFLEKRIGNDTFLIRQFGRERYQQDKRQWDSIGSGVESTSMSFSEYAITVESGQAYAEDLYLAKVPVTRTALVNEEALEGVAEKLPLKLPVTDWNLWIGPGGHTTCLHYDPFDGVLVQLSGKKRVVLYPPSQLYNLYPFHILNHLKYGAKLRSGYSQIYPDAIDEKAFPRVKEAQRHRYEVILNPGECLFIPAGWWHEVSTLGDGLVCSVNQFWNVSPGLRALGLWSKWRVHLASVLAAPHVMKSFVSAIASRDKSLRLGQLFQRL